MESSVSQACASRILVSSAGEWPRCDIKRQAEGQRLAVPAGRLQLLPGAGGLREPTAPLPARGRGAGVLDLLPRPGTAAAS